MKNIVKKFFALLTVFILCFTQMAVSAEDSVVMDFGDVAGIPGDVDVDTNITSLDMVTLRKILLGLTGPQSFLTSDVNEDNKIDLRDLVKFKKIVVSLGILDGATQMESYLSNAYKLMTNINKKLTLGFIGGSITYGAGATFDGTIDNSWVNLTSEWFKEQFPEVDFETVNAGVSDTATNYALYRLEKCLMNNDGHRIPDVVFVEFTNNDWITSTQSSKDLECQIESLFRNIYSINPCAEIIVVSTVRTHNESYAAYKKIADIYGIPIIDVGTVLQEKMTARGYANESSGNYYYTADNLHPSSKGYKVYFEVIKEFLQNNVVNLKIESNYLYNFRNYIPLVHSANCITSPNIISADSFTVSGNAIIGNTPVICEMYGTDKVVDKLEIVSKSVAVNGTTTITAKFEGSTLGLLFQLTSDTNINLTYSIDGGSEKSFAINETSRNFQRYYHSQCFMLTNSLSKGSHTIMLKFGNSDKCFLGAVLTNQ